MKQNKHHKLSANILANFILIVFSLLFLIFYPYHKTFWGGLIFSFANAGLIGGIADWFAIKSFFAKPLGISWPESLFKTEMIPKNREEVISVIIDIIQNKVITKDALSKKVKEIGISQLLVDYIVQHKILNNATEVLLTKIEISSLQKNNKYFSKLIRKSIYANKNEIYNIADHFSDLAISKGYIQDIINSLASELQKILLLPIVYEKLSILFTNIKSNYNGSNILKKVVTHVFSSINDVPEELIKSANDFLESAKHPDFIKKYDIKNKIQHFFQYSAIKTARDGYQFKAVNTDNSDGDSCEIKENIISYKEDSEDNIKDEVINKVIDELNNVIINNTDLKNKIANLLDCKISDFIYKNIEYIIKNKLAEYSNEMLTEEIYKNVGEDLNMIRINGSIVGGMVGIITFIIMYFV
ncbi:MAG: DUF445 family protein [Bacillota bacterium]|nr:DUF445 family protein [Bacillota bacterium]